MRRRLLAAGIASLAALAAAAPSAQAHAVLEGTSPARGADLPEPPEQVVFRFSEPVELGFGAVRVHDSEGDEVQAGEAAHPGGRGDEVAVDLPPGLPDGPYTATYRVVSADSHPVSGGFVFAVGDGESASPVPVSELVEDGDAGAATDVLFAFARWISYAAIALAVGGALFVLLVWAPALARAPASVRDRATEGAAPRALRLALIAIVLGLAGSILGIAMQGVVASGGGIADGFRPDVVDEVLGTRFGTVWAARLLLWVAVGVILFSLRRSERARPAAEGRAGAAGLLVLGLLLAIAVTPSLAGHAGTLDPAIVLIPADTVHVLAMGAWTGGIAALLFAVPAATRALEPEERSPILAAVLSRFSAVALVSVAALVATGVLQSLLELDSLSALFDTAFGRLILVKAGLLAVLLALGAYNRQRSVPRMKELAESHATPGRTGVLLRRALRAEVALLAAAIAAASFLVAQTPTSSGSGPASGDADLGGARLDYTVDPATVGENEIHLYLTDRDTGEPFEVREATLTASLPGEDIGPLEVTLRRAGPGHFTAPDASLAVSGEWTLAVSALVSRFEQLDGEFEVDVE